MKRFLVVLLTFGLISVGTYCQSADNRSKIAPKTNVENEIGEEIDTQEEESEDTEVISEEEEEEEEESENTEESEEEEEPED